MTWYVTKETLAVGGRDELSSKWGWENWLHGSIWGENKQPNRKMESQQKLVLRTRGKVQAARDARRKRSFITNLISALDVRLDFCLCEGLSVVPRV